jgi:hypothetical protein
MKLPGRLRRALLDRCTTAALESGPRLPADSFLGHAYREGRAEEALEEILEPFLAELTLGEGMKILTLAGKYPACDLEERARIEQTLEEIARGVAGRVPGDNHKFEALFDAVKIMLG